MAASKGTDFPAFLYDGGAAGVRKLARFGNICETASLIWNSALQKLLRLEAAHLTPPLMAGQLRVLRTRPY
jgi:hypothetical protein